MSDCCKSVKVEDLHLTGGSENTTTANMSYEEGCTGITFDISEITYATDEDSNCSNPEAGEEEEDEEEEDDEEEEEDDQEVEEEEEESVEGDSEDSDLEWGKEALSGSELSDSDQLKCHSEVHQKLRELCADCGAFLFVGKTHTCEYKIKPVPCNVCGKRCKDQAALKSHSRIHKEGYLHFCKFCMAPFKTRLDKLAHQGAHTPAERPYVCPDCAMTFSKLRVRDLHLKEHRGPNSVSCPFCALVFPAAHCIKRHMLVHTGERKFVCEFCSRSFSQHGHLKSHLRLHTGEKPFMCPHCDKSFNHNVSLKSHVMRYHKGDAHSGPREPTKDSMDKVELPGMVNEKATSTEGVIDRDIKLEDEPKKQIKKTYHRSTGRPKGRPKRNAATGEMSLVPAVPEEEPDPITAEVTEEDEESQGKGRKNKRKAVQRPDGLNTAEEDFHSDSGFDPAEEKTKKRRTSWPKSGNVRGRGMRNDGLVRK